MSRGEGRGAVHRAISLPWRPEAHRPSLPHHARARPHAAAAHIGASAYRSAPASSRRFASTTSSATKPPTIATFFRKLFSCALNCAPSTAQN